MPPPGEPLWRLLRPTVCSLAAMGVGGAAEREASAGGDLDAEVREMQMLDWLQSTPATPSTNPPPAAGRPASPSQPGVGALQLVLGPRKIGLRRAGVGPEERKELKALYHRLFLSGGLMGEEVKAALAEGPGERAREMLEFIAASKRGVSSHGRSRGG